MDFEPLPRSSFETAWAKQYFSFEHDFPSTSSFSFTPSLTSSCTCTSCTSSTPSDCSFAPIPPTNFEVYFRSELVRQSQPQPQEVYSSGMVHPYFFTSSASSSSSCSSSSSVTSPTGDNSVERHEDFPIFNEFPVSHQPHSHQPSFDPSRFFYPVQNTLATPSVPPSSAPCSCNCPHHPSTEAEIRLGFSSFPQNNPQVRLPKVKIPLTYQKLDNPKKLEEHTTSSSGSVFASNSTLPPASSSSDSCNSQHESPGEETENKWGQCVSPTAKEHPNESSKKRTRNQASPETDSETKQSPRKKKECGDRRAPQQRLIWTKQLHSRFLEALDKLGVTTAMPKDVLVLMGVEGLTRENISSHLQKHRIRLLRQQADAEEEKTASAQFYHRQIPYLQPPSQGRFTVSST